MGDTLRLADGATMTVTVHTVALAGQRLVVTDNGKPFDAVANATVPAGGDATFAWHADGKPHWLRVDVRSPEGKLLALGNPIYITPL